MHQAARSIPQSCKESKEFIMRKWNWLKGLLSVGTALVGSAALAGDVGTIPTIADPDHVFQQTSYDMGVLGLGGDQCNSCEGGTGLGSWFSGENGDPWKAIDASECGWNIGGWTEFGYSNKSDGVFETHPRHFDLQQFNLFVEKVADGKDGIGFGGRVDVMYGTDAQNTQAFGNQPGKFDYLNGWNHGVYGWAMPQLYAEVAADDLSVKVGHFYTLLGYQVVPATGNFFYSIPLTFNFGEAFTHTGALATYKASDTVTAYAGWTLGWDTGFNQLGSGSSFLGGAAVKVTDSLTATYITTFGNMGWIGDGYAHSLVLDWIINEKWEYVFQTDTIRTNGGPAGQLHAGNPYDTVGLNQYLYYTINPKLKLGGRAEWWKADGQSYNEITAGINIMPTANIRLRPEIRHQWAPGANNVANQFGLPVDQTMFAFDVIFTF